MQAGSNAYSRCSMQTPQLRCRDEPQHLLLCAWMWCTGCHGEELRPGSVIVVHFSMPLMTTSAPGVTTALKLCGAAVGCSPAQLSHGWQPGCYWAKDTAPEALAASASLLALASAGLSQCWAAAHQPLPSSSHRHHLQGVSCAAPHGVSPGTPSRVA